MVKLECPVGQGVRGYAVKSGRMAGLACEPTLAAAPTACSTVEFQGRDQRRSSKGGDFAHRASKGQCADNEYVAGVASEKGKASALLCCGLP
jgi:hypothetical protein